VTIEGYCKAKSLSSMLRVENGKKWGVVFIFLLFFYYVFSFYYVFMRTYAFEDDPEMVCGIP